MLLKNFYLMPTERKHYCTQHSRQQLVASRAWSQTVTLAAKEEEGGKRLARELVYMSDFNREAHCTLVIHYTHSHYLSMALHWPGHPGV